MQADKDGEFYTWWYDLDTFPLDEIKAIVEKDINQLLTAGWLDMSVLEYEYTSLFDEDEEI